MPSQPAAVATFVTVIVVVPKVASSALGTVNVPDAPVIVSAAVLPVEVFAPLRLYVTMNEPAPSDVELTVTTDPEPKHECVAVGDVKLLTSAAAFSVTLAAEDDAEVDEHVMFLR